MSYMPQPQFGMPQFGHSQQSFQVHHVEQKKKSDGCGCCGCGLALIGIFFALSFLGMC